MRPFVVVPDKPDEADRRAILAPLKSYNERAGAQSRHEPVAALLRDRDTDQTIGGLWGQYFYDWLYIELLFVPQRLRGRQLGSQLIETAEQLAREQECVGVWLDTFGFQAPEFYQGLGYEVFGQLPDHPRGWSRFFLRKILRGEG